MFRVYFSQLPQYVDKSTFQDTINKHFLQSTCRNLGRQQPIVILAIPNTPTSKFKHYGEGSIEFDDEAVVQEFLSKVRQFTTANGLNL